MAERLACVYVDLDGTLLGRDGSFVHDGDGAFSLLGARALEACARAGAEVVLFSGRRRANVEGPARLLGQRAFIYEAGAALVLDGELELLTGGLVPVDGHSIHDQITESGAPALLLETYAGRLEYHDPWHLGRDISHLFRGEVDAFEADAMLAAHGHGNLRLVDNGAIQRRPTGLAVERPRAYHLVPREASKARAVARHQRARLPDRGVHRGRRLPRGPRRGGDRGDVLARRQRSHARSVDRRGADAEHPRVLRGLRRRCL